MKDNCCGEKLIALGTAIAFEISQGQSPENLSILGAFFTVIGDQLSLLAAARASNSTAKN